MNPTFHELATLETYPCTSSAVGRLENQFHLRMQYKLGGDFQNLLKVYVPNELQAALLTADVQGLHIETLEVNSLAARLLTGSPGYLVMGIRLRGGEEQEHVPHVFKIARRRRGFFAVVTSLAGTAALFYPGYAWAGALLLLYGTHSLRTLRALPNRPFTVYQTHR